jgi:hypothetical protein
MARAVTLTACEGNLSKAAHLLVEDSVTECDAEVINKLTALHPVGQPVIHSVTPSDVVNVSPEVVLHWISQRAPPLDHLDGEHNTFLS